MKKDLDSLSLQELEFYGSEAQVKINESMNEILSNSRVIDMGEAGDRLKELVTVSKQSQKVLALRGPFATITNMLGKYDKLESQMSRLEENVDVLVNKLNLTLCNLEINQQTLANYVENLKLNEEDLKEYIEVLEERDDSDTTRLQVVVRRLKDIVVLRTMAEQNRTSSLINLQENKEAATQIANIKTNILPIIKMQLVNKIGAKIAGEAMAIKDTIYAYSNDLMLQNMEDMDKVAQKLIDTRCSSPYDIDTFNKVCDGMIKTMQKVAQSASVETKKNLEVISRMEETSVKMSKLMEGVLIESSGQNLLEAQI